jgi:hypothetical protein
MRIEKPDFSVRKDGQLVMAWNQGHQTGSASESGQAEIEKRMNIREGLTDGAWLAALSKAELPQFSCRQLNLSEV